MATAVPSAFASTRKSSCWGGVRHRHFLHAASPSLPWKARNTASTMEGMVGWLWRGTAASHA
eukprot:2085745-Lingulodinium_polyedra.AAC.1